MIEKFLTRFVNDDTKMVLAAMEKVGADLEASERLIRRSETMYDNARAIAPKIDLIVLTRAMRRIRETRNRARLRADTQDLAGKILMGEKFEDKNVPYYTGTAGAAQGISGLMNGANSMGQMSALGGGLMNASSMVDYQTNLARAQQQQTIASIVRSYP